jgi:replication factor C subunit 3/5
MMDDDVDMKPVEEEKSNHAAAAAASSAAAAAKAEATKESLPWVEKYRPTALDELISHADIINTVNKLIDSNQLPHLLFYGPVSGEDRRNE